MTTNPERVYERCEGIGELYEDGLPICPDCKGTGKQPEHRKGEQREGGESLSPEWTEFWLPGANILLTGFANLRKSDRRKPQIKGGGGPPGTARLAELESPAPTVEKREGERRLHPDWGMAHGLRQADRRKPQPTPSDGNTYNLVDHLSRQREWSERTFGPGMRTAGVIDHIRKELIEIEAAPNDLEKWIDVVILALDGAWRIDASPAQIVRMLVAKQTENEAREWPDWRTANPDKAIEHKPTPSASAHEDTCPVVAAAMPEKHCCCLAILAAKEQPSASVQEIAAEYAAIIERRINITLRDHGLPTAQVKALDELIALAITEANAARDAEIAGLRMALEGFRAAYSNRGEKTSLHKWNERMKVADKVARTALNPKSEGD